MLRFLLAGAAAVTLGSAPAFAITPEELWAAWQAQNAGQGQTLAATGTAREGDTLVLSGVTLTVAPAGGDVTAVADFGTVRMRDAGGGSVVVSLPDTARMTIENTGDEPGRIVLRLDQPGMTVTASGDPAAIAYEIAAPRVGMTLEEGTAAGRPMPLGLTASVESLAAAYRTTGTETQTIDGRFSAGAMNIEMTVEPSEGSPESFSLNLASANLAGTANGTIVPGVGTEPDIGKLLRSGFAVATEYAVGPTTFALRANDGNRETRAEGKADGGDFAVAMDAGKFAYRTGTKGFDITVAGGDLPVPEMRFQLAELGLGFLLPVAETPEPSEFSALLRVVDLVLPEAVWAMADPMGALKHEAVTAILDAAGQLRLAGDLFAPAAMEGGAPPGELHALEIRALQLKAAGADLTGAGSFTFDNTDLATFEGLPRPTGAIDLRLVGGNALLDTLAAMGMIPEDQIMGARMMLGLFARPGDGPDTLVSRIEVTPEGAVLANGQRLR